MDKTRERIQKLLALADCADEHEAALALERANELMRKHAISETEARGLDVHKVNVEGEDMVLSGCQGWQPTLVWALCNAFNCSSLRYHRSHGEQQRMEIYGTPDNRETVRQMYKFAIGQIDRFTEKARKEYKADEGYFPPRRFTTNYKLGVVFGMVDTLKGIYKANKEDTAKVAGGTCYALICSTALEAATNKRDSENPNLRSHYYSPNVSSGSAFHAGRSDGRTVSFNRQCGASSNRMLK